MQASQKPKAIIFDWDDTLVDTWKVVHNAVNTTLVAMGRDPWSEEEARQHLGPPARVLFTGLFGEDKWKEADKIYIQAYEDGIAEHLRVHEHVLEILETLQKDSVPLFVVSAKRGPLLRKEAAYLGLDKFFLTMTGAGDAKNDKPHADSVLLALKDSGIAPGPDVWFLGDSHTDLLTAANSTCKGVLIETKLPPQDKIDLNPPALRFKTHQQLLDYVRDWPMLSSPAPRHGAPKL